MMTISSSSNDLIAFGLQEFESYGDPHAYSCKPRFSLLGHCTNDGL